MDGPGLRLNHFYQWNRFFKPKTSQDPKYTFSGGSSVFAISDDTDTPRRGSHLSDGDFQNWFVPFGETRIGAIGARRRREPSHPCGGLPIVRQLNQQVVMRHLHRLSRILPPADAGRCRTEEQRDDPTRDPFVHPEVADCTEVRRLSSGSGAFSRDAATPPRS